MCMVLHHVLGHMYYCTQTLYYFLIMIIIYYYYTYYHTHIARMYTNLTPQQQASVLGKVYALL